MSDLLNQASLVMVPSGYKEDTVYSVVPSDGSGDLSFTRASNGTRVNSAGLVEVCPWNLLEQSETFQTLPWNTNAGATVDSNVATAPNGTTTADRINCTTSSGSGLYNIFNVVSGQSYTLSIYVKNDSNSTNVRIGTDAYPNTGWVNYNPSTNSIISVGGSITSSSVQSVGNGWYRVIFSYVSTGAFNSFVIYSNSGTTNSLFVWGAQCNIGSTAKPYFPTTDRLNVPRLTYQNGGGGCPSLLLEKQSTNLALQSTVTSFGTNIGDWLNGAASPASINQTTGIDGTQNGAKYTKTAGVTTDDYFYKAGVAVTPLSTYTISGYIKLGTASNAVIVINNSLAWDTIANGSFVCSSSNGFSTTAWKRFEITITAPPSGAINIHYGYHNETGVTAQADGTFFLDGLQVEQSSYATSLIPTTSSSATRVADACFKTGISSLIGQQEGVVFVDFMVTDPANFQSIQIYNNEKNASVISVISIQFNIDTVIAQIFKGNGTFDNILLAKNGYGLNQRLKVAFRYKSGDLALYINGVQADTDSSTYTANGTKAEVNLCDPSVYFAYKGCVNFYDFVQFPTALTNAELASLTTI